MYSHLSGSSKKPFPWVVALSYLLYLSITALFSLNYGIFEVVYWLIYPLMLPLLECASEKAFFPSFASISPVLRILPGSWVGAWKTLLNGKKSKRFLEECVSGPLFTGRELVRKCWLLTPRFGDMGPHLPAPKKQGKGKLHLQYFTEMPPPVRHSSHSSLMDSPSWDSWRAY